MYDAIIVGQGLAGSVLYHTLTKQGLNVFVIDNGHRSSSSLSAAGIYNPIIIKRLRQSWRGIELIKFAKEYYQKLESVYNWAILQDIPINRIFNSEREYQLWEDKLLEEHWDSRIEVCEKEIHGTAQYVGQVKNTGWLNIPKFLNLTKKMLLHNGHLELRNFEFDDLDIGKQEVTYGNINAKRVFFCEGYKISENPFFNELPLSPVKGELLTIYDPGLDLKEILHCGYFILPLGNHKFKVGSTFAWDTLDEVPTEKSKTELLNGIREFTSDNLEIIDHKAGVRPAVSDRKPLIGTHKVHRNIHIFNGLGTRGVMIAPFCANNFFNHVYHQDPLMDEINIDRFN